MDIFNQYAEIEL